MTIGERFSLDNKINEILKIFKPIRILTYFAARSEPERTIGTMAKRKKATPSEPTESSPKVKGSKKLKTEKRRGKKGKKKMSVRERIQADKEDRQNLFKFDDPLEHPDCHLLTTHMTLVVGRSVTMRILPVLVRRKVTQKTILQRLCLRKTNLYQDRRHQG